MAPLRLKDFAVRPRRGPSEAVRGVHLELGPGEVALISGAEASGKTALLRGILGFMPHTGEAEVLGARPGHATAGGRIGFAPEGRPFPAELRVEEMVGLIARLRGATAGIGEAIESCDLAAHTRTRLGRLDAEQARRAALACAAVGEPELLLLDDPWESPETIAVLDAARARGAAAVLATAVPGGLRRYADVSLELVDGAPA